MIDFIAEYETHLRRTLRRSESTITEYIRTLRRMDRELPEQLAVALPEELEAWIYREDLSQSTLRQRRAAVVGFFAFATNPKRQVRIDMNPAADLPPVSVPRRYARPAPTAVVYDAIRRGPAPARYWFTLAALAGARCVEIANLVRDDIGEDVTVLHGKGSKSRRVPTHPAVWAMARDLPDGPVAVTGGGRRLTRHQVSRGGNCALRELGHVITMHQLRHWFGTETYEASGHDIRAVQELLGHASVATTQVYVEVSKAAMTRAVAGLPVG